MKRWIIIAVSVVILFFVLGAVKDLMIKTVVEKGVQFVTGLKMEIGGFRIGLLNGVVDIKNLRLYNPPDFSESIMLNMQRIYVKYDLPAIIGGNIHLPELALEMKEFMVVKNREGKLNINSIKGLQAQKKSQAPAGKAPSIRIDKLKLKIGKAIYKDYTSGAEPRVIEYNVGIDDEYNNITDAYTLIQLIVVRSIMNTNISNLSGFDIGGLKDSVSGVLSDTVTNARAAAKTTVENAAGAVTDIFKRSFDMGK